MLQLLTLLLFFCVQWCHSFYTVSPYVYDEAGRVRIFHGINRIQKNAKTGYYFEAHKKKMEVSLYTLDRFTDQLNGINDSMPLNRI